VPRLGRARGRGSPSRAPAARALVRRISATLGCCSLKIRCSTARTWSGWRSRSAQSWCKPSGCLATRALTPSLSAQLAHAAAPSRSPVGADSALGAAQENRVKVDSGWEARAGGPLACAAFCGSRAAHLRVHCGAGTQSLHSRAGCRWSVGPRARPRCCTAKRSGATRAMSGAFSILAASRPSPTAQQRWMSALPLDSVLAASVAVNRQALSV